jgi:adenylate cyclase
MSSSPNPWQPLGEWLLGKAELTTVEVARAAGVDVEHARQLWRALGFPPVADDERLFTRSDVEILGAVRHLIELQGTDPEELLQMTRVIGQSLARLVDAQVTAVAGRLERLRGDGDDPVDSTDLMQRIETLTPTLEQFLGYVWRRHLLAALVRLSAVPSLADHSLTVGFADLVGFTTVSKALDAQELAAMVDRFEAIAYEHIPERGGRVVKMIGDEVMFAVDDPVAAAEIALALVEAHARDAELPDVRVGLASGPVLSWEGDLYGPTVNRASRLVNLARPHTVLVDDELGEQLKTHSAFALRHLRAVALKGIGRVRVWVLRRAA